MRVRVQVWKNDGRLLYEWDCPPDCFSQWEAGPAGPIVGDGQTIGRISVDVRRGFTETPGSLADAARALAICTAAGIHAADLAGDEDDDDSDLEELPEPVYAPMLSEPSSVSSLTPEPPPKHEGPLPF